MDTKLDEMKCPICLNKPNFVSVGACKHWICLECATRLRVLIKDKQCAICRTELSEVFFTNNCHLPINVINRKGIKVDQKYGIYFHSPATETEFTKLFEIHCNQCQFSAADFDQLAEHQRKTHELFFCEICFDHHKQLFPGEHSFYSRKELVHHRMQGDRADPNQPAKGKAVSALSGHPACKYCDQRYFDQDELFRHLRAKHFFCEFCQTDDRTHVFYPFVFVVAELLLNKEYQEEFFHRTPSRNYPGLLRHFRQKHFVCEFGQCRQARFTNVFTTEINYKSHVLSEHGGEMSKDQLNEISRIDLDFQSAGPPGRFRRRDLHHEANRSEENEPDEVVVAAPSPSSQVDFPSLPGQDPRAAQLGRMPQRISQRPPSMWSEAEDFPTLARSAVRPLSQTKPASSPNLQLMSRTTRTLPPPGRLVDNWPALAAGQPASALQQSSSPAKGQTSQAPLTAPSTRFHSKPALDDGADSWPTLAADGPAMTTSNVANNKTAAAGEATGYGRPPPGFEKQLVVKSSPDDSSSGQAKARKTRRQKKAESKEVSNCPADEVWLPSGRGEPPRPKESDWPSLVPSDVVDATKSTGEAAPVWVSGTASNSCFVEPKQVTSKAGAEQVTSQLIRNDDLSRFAVDSQFAGLANDDDGGDVKKKSRKLRKKKTSEQAKDRSSDANADWPSLGESVLVMNGRSTSNDLGQHNQVVPSVDFYRKLFANAVRSEQQPSTSDDNADCLKDDSKTAVVPLLSDNEFPSLLPVGLLAETVLSSSQSSTSGVVGEKSRPTFNATDSSAFPKFTHEYQGKVLGPPPGFEGRPKPGTAWSLGAPKPVTPPPVASPTEVVQKRAKKTTAAPKPAPKQPDTTTKTAANSKAEATEKSLTEDDQLQKKQTFRKPRDYDRRWEQLMKTVQNRLSNKNRNKKFKSCLREFKDKKLDAEQLYRTLVNDVFMELAVGDLCCDLVALTADIERQHQLFGAFCSKKTCSREPEDRLKSCDLCTQLMFPKDIQDHHVSHYIEE